MKNLNEKKQKFNPFKEAKFNSTGSTYFQKIILTNGVILKGYSQKTGFAEKTDKDDLLINFILRIFQNGYLDSENIGTRKQIEQIEYYLNDTHEIHFLNLYYNGFDILQPIFESGKVQRFLEQFYTEKTKLRKSQLVNKLYQKSRSFDIFDVSKKRFFTHDSLVEHCYLLIDKKQGSKQEVEHFYQKYKLKWNL